MKAFIESGVMGLARLGGGVVTVSCPLSKMFKTPVTDSPRAAMTPATSGAEKDVPVLRVTVCR
jgi:hypothetical protein